jgi:hypothetical protein
MTFVSYRDLIKIVRALIKNIAFLCFGVHVFAARMFIVTGHRPVMDALLMLDVNKIHPAAPKTTFFISRDAQNA